jgi:hypothetical protein
MQARAIPLSRLSDVLVRRTGPGDPDGEPLQIEDVPWIVREEIADALQAGRTDGTVSAGSDPYRWWLTGERI